MQQQLRLCLVAPTGSGKSTVAKYISRVYGGEILKIAKPLYELQHHFYRQIGHECLGQDGELLQFFGAKIEKERPGWLARQFLTEVDASGCSLIVNDDCRANSFEALKQAGFIFIRINTSRKFRNSRLRNDHTKVDDEHPVEFGIDSLAADYELDNNGTLEETYRAVDSLMQNLAGGRQGWLTGEAIIEEWRMKRITISPFNPACVNANSYNYHLAPTLLRIISPVVDLQAEDDLESIEVPVDGYLLQPGELYLGSTIEEFGSEFFASLITGRSSVGRKFITNHVTAGLIDQGFFGTITLEIVVHRETRIYPGMMFGQIFWFTTAGRPRLYNGKYLNQSGPVASRLHFD